MAFERGATQVLKREMSKMKGFDGLDRDFIDRVDAVVSRTQIFAHPFIACFSREPDILSQWRAYAVDGTGYAIGFNAAALTHMPVTMLSVEYDIAKQEEEMFNAIRATYLMDCALNDPNEFQTACIEIGVFQNAYKNPSFLEEKEVRCVHAVRSLRTDNSWKFVDEGGYLGGKIDVAGEPITFRTQRGSLVAQLDMPFRRGVESNAIKRVMLGPKCASGFTNVLFLLGQNGYENVEIGLSKATYR